MFGDYKDLSLKETIFVSKFLENYDLESIADIVRNNIEITDDMKRFIADVITGKIKRPKHKKNGSFFRDFEIHQQIEDFMYFDKLPLRGNRKDGAGAIVGERFGITEETAVKAYQRIRHYQIYSQINDLLLDGLPLDSTPEIEGAGATVAKEIGISTKQAISAYKEICGK